MPALYEKRPVARTDKALYAFGSRDWNRESLDTLRAAQVLIEDWL